MKSLIIDYVNLLHRYGLGSKKAEKFKERHNDDPIFLRRAKTLERLWTLRSKI